MGEGEGEGGSTGGLPAIDTQKCILPFPSKSPRAPMIPKYQVLSVMFKDRH